MDGSAPPSVALPPPTLGRYKVLAFLCMLALILYIDRICISTAVPAIEADLHISHTAMGFVLAAFTLAYCLFEIPTGSWGDRYGSRGVMTRIVLWWSAFTALTGAAFGLWSLLLVRFLFGAGEAGAFPNTARVIGRWFPTDRRGPAQGLINTTALVGGAISPAAAAYLIDAVGWRCAFVIFAMPGIVWAIAFHRWFRDNPAAHPAVNEAECQLIGSPTADPGGIHHPPIPWRRVLTNVNVLLLGGVIACSAFNSYLYFSWYPTYLEQARAVDSQAAGWLASLVLGVSAVGCIIGGFLSDWLIRITGDRRFSRRGLGCAGLTMGVAFLVAGQHTDGSVLAATWTALAMFAVHLTLPNWWGAVADISGRHLGALFGLMNSIGGLGAIASQLFLGRFVDWMGSRGFAGRAQWDPAFYLYAGILLVGAIGWLWIDVTRPVEFAVTVPVVEPPLPAEPVTAIMDQQCGRGLRAGHPASDMQHGGES
jgi:MFS transporter, ACS family, glucarate transporter